jgi:hypothetical protein
MFLEKTIDNRKENIKRAVSFCKGLFLKTTFLEKKTSKRKRKQMTKANIKRKAFSFKT